MSENQESSVPKPKRIMHLAGEFAAIVIGVLFAMSLEAWWQKQQNLSRVDLYLDQLRSDIQHADSLLLSSKRQSNTFLENIASLNRTLGEPVLPSPDSLRNQLLLSLNYADYMPDLGITQTLVETGDINLIEDTALRNQVIQYVTISSSHRQLFKSLTDESLKAVGQFGTHVDLYGYLQGRPTRFPMDWEALANSQAATSILRNIQLLLQNQYVVQGRAQIELRSLGEKMGMDLEETTVPGEVLAGYAGTYAIDSTAVFTITSNQERLFIEVPGAIRFELYPITATAFRENIWGIEVTFEVDSLQHTPTAFDIKMPGRAGIAQRVE